MDRGRQISTGKAGPDGLARLRPVFAAALSALLLTLGLTSSTAAPKLVPVIVQGPAAARAVADAGGRVTASLPIVDGVGARVPETSLARLRALDGVHDVWRDARVSFNTKGPDSEVAHRVQKVVRADRAWAEGVTGRGVTVALLDTGVHAAHPDLQGPAGSRVVHCEDLSHEAGTAAHCRDTFGHGTFMAGLIAGNGASSDGRYVGAAPEAGIVAVKVAGFDGSTDVSHVLAGIQWVVAHRDAYDIRALNLSLGTDSSQDYRLSPLNLAVERAWSSGIAVVVSAGNTGPSSATVMKPGDDPFVITVGASNDEGTLKIGDDRVPAFSGRGPTRANGFAKPDVVSPGVHTVSLRSPGSAVDQKYGATATVGDHYFKGTGTSMSTATVSGIVALMLQRDPTLAPDQVKYRVVVTARPIAESDVHAAGRGLVDAYAAATTTVAGSANQGLEPSAGLGLLELDRASLGVNVAAPLGGLALRGEVVALNDLGGSPITWSAQTYATTGWDATTWNGTSWNAGAWAGTSWNGTSWNATTWNGMSWNGTSWNNSDWNATTWNDADWNATTWNATTWNSKWYAAAWE